MKNDILYAVAVRNGAALSLVCRIRRSGEGDIYVLLPRDEPGADHHASYHKSGHRHVKSHKPQSPWQRRQMQEPNASFHGAEQVFASTFQPGELARHKTPCVAEKFKGVFEIPLADLDPTQHYTLAVDLVEPSHGPVPVPWEAVKQKSFPDRVPWILVTLWKLDT